MDIERDDTIREVWLNGIYGRVLLSNLLCGLMNEHWSDVLDFANALICCRREIDFSGVRALEKVARIRRLPTLVRLSTRLQPNTRTSSSVHLGQTQSPVAVSSAAVPSLHFVAEQVADKASSVKGLDGHRTSRSVYQHVLALSISPALTIDVPEEL